jgi:Bacterial regulatory helix-turn-helix protein, lysR family
VLRTALFPRHLGERTFVCGQYRRPVRDLREAAGRLLVSQPALSQQIRGLRGEVGLRLFGQLRLSHLRTMPRGLPERVVAEYRRFLPERIDLVCNGKINPGKVFDLELPLEQTAEGYKAMHERRAIKVLLTV